MATAVATSGAKGVKRDVPFSWTGMDKKGNRVSGKSLAPDETALRADLRRQGIAVSKIKKQSTALKGGGKVNAGDIADQAAKEGVWDLRRAGLEKVKQGMTSIEEVNSVTIE